MRASFRSTIFGLALLSTASAVQLANFQTLTISNAQCRAAYTTNIEGCQPSDFEPNGSARCTEACVAGLKKIGEVVKRVCKDVDLGDASIIGVFKLDVGVTALCPRIATATSSVKAPEKTSAQPSPSSSSKAASSAPQSSTLVTSRSSAVPTSTSITTESPSSQSDAPQSSSTSSQGIMVDPNPTSISVAPPPASSTEAPAPSRTPVRQLSNADSGGGSPFDVQAGTGASTQLRAIDFTMAALISTALLFSAFA